MVTRSAPLVALSALALAMGACSGRTAREYELKGQVLAVDVARQEITIRHGDIPGFMPGMTMAFKVREARILEDRNRGDLVEAVLVVDGTDAHLRRIEPVGFEPLPEGDAPPVRPIEPGEAVEDAGFLDDRGEPRRLEDWRGRVLAVTFIYTRCPLPDYCPLIDRHFKEVQEAILADGELKAAVRLLSITLDPEYDTPEVLAAHARRVGADGALWRFLSPRDGGRFAAQFGVATFRSDPVEIVHNLRTAVVDEEGRLRTVLNGTGWSPDELLTAIRNARAAR